MENKDLFTEEEISDLLEEEGVELIEFKVMTYNDSLTLRCVVDYPHGGINLDECVRLNRKIVEFLEQRNAEANVAVEVNSPGLDRKLKTVADFKRIYGRTVMLWLSAEVEGKAYWEGEIVAVNDNRLVIRVNDREIAVDFSLVQTGREKIGMTREDN